ncbi:uncharacterized protein LOC105664817 isoform X1 [Ceratitis capitata]|uniref:(Mediterranean fruit fly) hypothetical protein n=1 Tax=Ceratitis capitata TaxID=7213 RepID=W8C7K9_CERCA|nr:uncharacterized protein LOC105664817 isoform X1 [Ceratitis capitata]CAD7004083.1 unnamed protein product [Ceratitis capitata]
MKILFAFLLCACGIAITLAAPQYTYVDPYTTSLPQFSQLSSTPYTGYGQNIRIWPWVIGQYAYPSYQYYSTYWNNLNNNPSSYPYNSNGYNGYINYNGYNGYNGYNPYNIFNKYNSYNPYNPYNRNTGTNTYWNGYAWVNSFRSTQAGKK